MKLGIVARRGDPRAADLAADLHATLSTEGVEVVLDEVAAGAAGTGSVPVEEMADCPLVVSVGGDGTFLHAARSVGSTPILGVNLGEVGFLNAVAPDEAADRVREEVVRLRETGEPRFREATRVEARGDGWSLPPALNEVVVAGPGRGHGRGLDVEVRIDGSRYAGGHADGVLVATQTGSTAYNLSEGGPLVHPSADGLIVTGMCAAETMPPLVVGPESEVSIRAAGVDRAVVAADAHERRWVEAPAVVRVGAADEPARIAGPPPDFFGALDKIGRRAPRGEAG